MVQEMTQKEPENEFVMCLLRKKENVYGVAKQAANFASANDFRWRTIRRCEPAFNADIPICMMRTDF